VVREKVRPNQEDYEVIRRRGRRISHVKHQGTLIWIRYNKVEKKPREKDIFNSMHGQP
jgi:hypothetical protein